MQEGSNQLAVTPLVPHGFSNIVVSLVEESRPLVFEVRTNSRNTHYRRDFTVQGMGPNAEHSATEPSAEEPRIRVFDNIMMAFAIGTDIPGNAVRLRTDNSAVRAWRYDGAVYLQSRETVISPPASQILTAAGQIRAYRIRPTGVALISVGGIVSKVRISQCAAATRTTQARALTRTQPTLAAVTVPAPGVSNARSREASCRSATWRS